jgi:hypothetical protein
MVSGNVQARWRGESNRSRDGGCLEAEDPCLVRVAGGAEVGGEHAVYRGADTKERLVEKLLARLDHAAGLKLCWVELNIGAFLTIWLAILDDSDWLYPNKFVPL